MQTDSALIQELKAQLAELKQGFADLKLDHERLIEFTVKHIGKHSDEMLRQLDEHHENLDRIVNLENKVFPSIQPALEHVRRTIGFHPVNESNPLDNPLDKRKRD